MCTKISANSETNRCASVTVTWYNTLGMVINTSLKQAPKEALVSL